MIRTTVIATGLGALVVAALSASLSTSAGAGRIASGLKPTSQSSSGTPLLFPSVIPPELGPMAYSPDGTKLAITARGSVWVWTLAGTDVVQIRAAEDIPNHGCVFTYAWWADPNTLIACENRTNQTDLAAHQAGELPDIDASLAWVLIDPVTGERLRTVVDAANGGSDGLGVVGFVDRDVWYIRALDGKLRKYDSRTQTVGSEAYYECSYAQGTPVQTAPGSPWFSVMIPNDPPSNLHLVRLEVFNIDTGERRSVSNVHRRQNTVTADGRYFITTRTDADGTGFPVLFDLVQGMEFPLPENERWGPDVVSAARGVVLATVWIPTDVPKKYNYQYVEVPLAALTQM